MARLSIYHPWAVHVAWNVLGLCGLGKIWLRDERSPPEARSHHRSCRMREPLQAKIALGHSSRWIWKLRVTTVVRLAILTTVQKITSLVLVVLVVSNRDYYE
ncbi:hypothetical protein AVEN_65327-1 [Araneus ventricosus]|uniref:Uncharacterized protein n=1 Tax=Araneus ventricosus TaxID=182803 RepID=A0A4Y2AHM4_ARAVE|nr:hypothetical protein AVEN_65327-1 [Araneus ventricosus]